MNQRERLSHTIAGAGPILIDGFRFRDKGCTAYFLTHFHSDHYSGLDDGFPWGNTTGALLFCSPVTAQLVVAELGVEPALIRVLPFGQTTPVLDFQVTLLPVNHCPGAAMLLFRLSDG